MPTSIPAIDVHSAIEIPGAHEAIMLWAFIDRARLKDSNSILKRLAANRAASLLEEPSRQPHAKFARANGPILMMPADLKRCIGHAVIVVPQLDEFGEPD